MLVQCDLRGTERPRPGRRDGRARYRMVAVRPMLGAEAARLVAIPTRKICVGLTRIRCRQISVYKVSRPNKRTYVRLFCT